MAAAGPTNNIKGLGGVLGLHDFRRHSYRHRYVAALFAARIRTRCNGVIASLPTARRRHHVHIPIAGARFRRKSI
jgi:hypothetical protein